MKQVHLDVKSKVGEIEQDISIDFDLTFSMAIKIRISGIYNIVKSAINKKIIK